MADEPGKGLDKSKALGRIQAVQAVGTVREFKVLDLGDLNELYRGVTFQVWVTPTREHKEEIDNITQFLFDSRSRVKREMDKIKDPAERAECEKVLTAQTHKEWVARMKAWLSETWLDWEPDEVDQLHAALSDRNPMAWDWLVEQTGILMGAYRSEYLKN